MNTRIFDRAAFAANVLYRFEGKDRSLQVDISPSDTLAEGRDSRVALRVELKQRNDELQVDCELESFADGVELLAVEPLRIDERWDPTMRAYHQGWESWSGTSSVGPDEKERRPHFQFLRDVTTNPAAPRLKELGLHMSDLVTAIQSKERHAALVAGFITNASQFGFFEIDIRPNATASLVARLPFDGVRFDKGDKRQGERLVLWWGDRADILLERWAATAGQTMGARIPERSTVGWCSWYYYFTKIDHQIISENLERLQALGNELPLGLFQVDDGYQDAIGNWLVPNKKFPKGMAPVAQAIAQAGYKPGLWLAPFIARSEAPLYKKHPDWFVRTPGGKRRYALYNPMWGVLGTAKALDTTHPEVLDWLKNVFSTVTKEWGFRFLKIDFLYAAALPGRRHDPKATGAEALRRGLEAIRESVGDDVHILGCGCPLGPAIGLVDSMRIGIDVAPDWHTTLSRRIGRDYDMLSTSNALRNVFTRAFCHGRLWQNDPDCLLVRDDNSRLTLDEVRSLATIAALSGGTLLVSDNLSKLAPERLAVARQAIRVSEEIHDARPRCLDLMDSEYPSLLWAPRKEGGAYLAVMNPDDEARAFLLDLRYFPELSAAAGRDGLEEIWSDETVPIRGNILDLGVLPKHAVRLLRIPAS